MAVARALSTLYLVLLACVLAVPTLAQPSVPVNGKEVQPVQVVEPTVGDSSQPADPTVTKPDQTFYGRSDGIGTGVVAVEDGDIKVIEKPRPDAEVLAEPITSGRRLQTVPRKLLGTVLDLSGEGVSAGNQDAGVAANAFGHGTNTGVGGTSTHIEPHGADVKPTVAGKQVSATAAGNPDGVGGEGPVVTAGRK